MSTGAMKTSRESSLSNPSSPNSPAIGELFDELNALSIEGVSRIPQVVIAGDQSCGKSSVFEALTGLSCPPNKRYVTHFPVCVQLRYTQSEKTSVNAHLIAGPSDEGEESVLRHLSSFHVSEEYELFTGKDFVEIVEDASIHLRIPCAEGSNDISQERFSDATLNIEVSGPQYHSLKIIDLPGIMHHATSSQIQQDAMIVKNHVLNLISHRRTVIVAVGDATNKIGNQEIFQLAKAVDPQGYRTVGVLTKCDAIQPGDEDRALRVAQNRTEYLPRGWIAIKNRSTRDVSRGVDMLQRDMDEQLFFNTSPWNTLPSDRVGREALKKCVTGLLNDMSHEGFNALVNQIQMLRSTAQSRSSSGDTLDTLKTIDEKGVSLDVTKVESDESDEERGTPAKRPTVLINPCTVALTVAMSLTLVGLGAREISQEIATDGDWSRLALLFSAPLQLFVSLFFCQSLINTICQLIGPVNQMKTNSKFYTAIAPRRLSIKNGPLPHVTVECPVYKEGLEAVIIPTIRSVQHAMANYESHGGTCSIFVNDDGMQLISADDAQARRDFYAANNIGWVARPKHNPNGEGLAKFARKGKFKKASNMNFGLALSIKVEDKLLQVERDGPLGWSQDDEDAAYQKCLQEVLADEKGRAWAEGNIRLGDYILIIDSDTRIPVECMIDAVSEMDSSPRVAILQFPSGVMNVTTSFFEMGITFFTNLIYTAIRYAVAAGDVSPFVGHNAFLRWAALQETCFYEEDEITGLTYEKFWSESHVSEDFDIALRLQTQGWLIRLGGFCGTEFKEGVSLTVYDELARWEKYAYGCNELLFHPVKYWLFRGPFTPLFKTFITSSMPIGSKVTIMAYIGTYYAIGYAWLATLLNYFLMGWFNGFLDHFYMDSWKIWVALVVVFSGAGNFALAVVRYRSEGVPIFKELFNCFRWVPLLFVFLGGISMHVSQALLSHMFSIDMTWGATAKEIEDTSFYIELPLIVKRFKFTFIFCILAIALMICGAYVFPPLWKINTLVAVFPLACMVAGHFLLPVLLNPALMKFTW